MPFYFEKNSYVPLLFRKKPLIPLLFRKKTPVCLPLLFRKKTPMCLLLLFQKNLLYPFYFEKNSYVPAPFLTALDSYLLSGSSILELLFPKHTASVLSYSVKVRDRSKLTGYIGRVLGKFA